mgnify:CR=1 FL=1
MEIYLDNSATTKCFDEVAQVVAQMMTEDYGNPSSSMHLKGVKAEKHIRQATEVIARSLKVNEKEIFYTSGGTESDNMAIIGTAMANYRAGKHIITTPMEHPAVGQCMKYLEKEGFEITYLQPDSTGCISLDDLEKNIRKDTILVSIMAVNNEIGTIQPIEKAGELIKRCNVNTLFHVDAVQAAGKIPLDLSYKGIDFASISAHKIGGPRGIGILYAKDKFEPFLRGGGQENGLRSGTENLFGSEAISLCLEKYFIRTY